MWILSSPSVSSTLGGPVLKKNIFDDLIEGSESLDKMVNATAFVLRLAGRKGKAISESHKKLDLQGKYDSNPITTEEHEIALITLIHHEQNKLDVKKFSGFNITKKEVEVSPTKTLSLFIMRSRVQNFPIREGNESDFVYPLPKGTFAKRIVLKFHKKFHKDLDTICAHVRRNYWIQNMRKIAASIDRNCKFCLILRQKVSSQLMGDLPLYRSTPSGAFESCNLDLFGPILVKDSVVKRGPRVRKKMYGVLFACCVTRAIYLDYAEDYSTESVLHCIRRLMAERGSVSRLISDPGTQLKGASNELKEVRDGWSEAELIRFGAKHGITWEFVMASSQHQNGAAEILIKMCKGVMKALMAAIGTTVLNTNELLTLLKETQNLCNERPIGLKPNQDSDPQFLSPNSLLIGRCSDRIPSGPFQSKASFQDDPESDRNRFLKVQQITNQFWRNWMKSCFPTLIRRQKWHHDKRNVKIDDVCMLKDANAMRGEWRMSRVVETFPDEHGKVRNVKLTVPPPGLDGSRVYRSPAMSKIERHVSNVIVIVPNDDEDLEDLETGIGGSEELSEPATQPALTES